MPDAAVFSASPAQSESAPNSFIAAKVHLFEQVVSLPRLDWAQRATDPSVCKLTTKQG